jgi:hypothetical protein
VGLPVSLLLIAVGAILTWAVTADTNGIDLNTVGVILMIVGIVGLVLTLLFWRSWWGPTYFRRTAYVDDYDAPPRRSYRTRRRTVAEDDGPRPSDPPPY